ncbi:MAG: NADH:flavin oxidoreductase [Candidatus Lokiarchaeota archaeon]|nr:NADH:flavin oxidoreductase [Candidatus Lokiarchaeota archaeon]
MELTKLFSPSKIGSIKIKNRIVRSATWVARADEVGYVTEDLINFYRILAEGGIGLIISGYIGVHERGAGNYRMTRLYNESYKVGQKKLVSTIHDTSDTKIAAQIAHTGSNIIRDGYELIGPSAIKVPGSIKLVRELSIKEIQEIVSSFITTGTFAYECGYDMIQLHGAHGYLLSDFLSPFTNKRNDEYGGSMEKRFRIIEEIYHGLRDELGKDYPIMIKLNTHDNLNGGLSFEEGKEFAKKLVSLGLDAIEPSSGRTNPRLTNNKTFPAAIIKSSDEENYFTCVARELKPLMANCALIFMGGIRNPITADQFLKEEIADFISMSRPFLYEPDLANRWESGNLDPAYCTSCNACFGTVNQGGIYCPIKKKHQDKISSNGIS